jgi:O-antigen/teichoic acid export membrane protein
VLVLTQNFILYLLIQMLNQISVNVIVARKVDRDYPYLKECKELPDKETCASISKNILAMSMHRIGGAVVNGTDNLIMSAFVGLSSAGIYSNYQLVFSNVNLLLHKIYNAFGTSIGNLAATENTGKIYGIYKQLDFFMFALYGYLSVGIFVMINPLIELLFGKEYLFSIPLVFVMTANFYITGMRQINLQFRSAMGLFWHDRYRPLFEAVINLVVSIVLVQTYGVLGILTGTIVSTLTTCFWTEPYVLMRYGMKDDWKHKLKSYFTTYAVRTGSVVLAGAVSYQICRLIGGTNPGWFLIKCGICTIIYWAVFWCGYSRCEEYVYLKERVGAVVEKVRRKWK